LATRLAPLSHMLMNGFFFNHGLDTRELLLNGRAAAWIGCLGVLSFVPSTPSAARSTADPLLLLHIHSFDKVLPSGPGGCAA